MHRRRADVTRFARVDHVIKGLQRLFDGRIVIPAVDLQQVDVIHVQAAQAVIDGAQDLRPGQPFGEIADLMVNLRRNDDLITTGKIAQGAAHDLLAAAVGVAIGGVKEVNAALKGAFDDGAAALFWQRPGVIPAVRLAKRHAAQAKSGNLEVCFS